MGTPVTETVRTTLHPPSRKQIINPSRLVDFSFLRIPKPSVVSVIGCLNGAGVCVSLWPQTWRGRGLSSATAISMGGNKGMVAISPGKENWPPSVLWGPEGTF